MIALNSTGPEVRAWQEALAARGYKCKADGAFGTQTHNATLALQAAAGLRTTGIVGDAERVALNKPAKPLPLLVLCESIPFIECKFWSRGITRTSIDWIVLHCMEAPETASTAGNCARYLANLPDDTPKEKRRSCAYFVDSEFVVQGVRDECIAWHAPGANRNGIGIEHAGFARQSRDEWLDEFGSRMLALSAELTARLCKRWSIPPVFLESGELLLKRRGITTHAQVTLAFPERGHGHMDPGPGFPIDWYLARVDAALRV